MLIAEDLMLLLLDDESGALTRTNATETALGGALLAELALAERVEVGERKGRWSTATVRAIGGAPADPLLARAHAQVAEKERGADALVGRLGKGTKDEVIARLVEREIVREQKDRVLGLFPRTRWPAVDSRHEDGVRRSLAAALLEGVDPDPRTATLVALLGALDQAHKAVPHEGVSNGQVRKRAKAIAEGQWAVKGVADAIAATNAAVMAAVTAATVASTTASSGS